MSSSEQWGTKPLETDDFDILNNPPRNRQGSSNSYDSGYGSSRSAIKPSHINANSYCGRHSDRYRFGRHSIGKLWRQITRRRNTTKSGAQTASLRHIPVINDGGPGKGALRSDIVQKCRKTIRHLKLTETSTKIKGEGKDKAGEKHGDEVETEPEVEATASHKPARPATIRSMSTLSALPTDLNHNQRTAATKPAQNISPHPVSSNDDLTGDDSELTDSNDASSSDGTWSLESVSRALKSPGVTTCTILSQYQARLVDSLMSEFHSLINSESVVARSRAASEGSSNNCSGSSGSSTREDTTPSSGRGTKKRQRDQGVGDRSDKDQDQDSGPSKMQRIQSPSPSTVSKKLACPYFRHHPAYHTRYRSCAGPGWPTVHRVKEHVYRRHSASIRCARCGETFEAESNLEAHYRLPQRCEVRPEALQPEELTKEQEKALRRRKKLVSEEEKWRDMYRILFPVADDGDGGDDDNIPSPYYDDSPAQFADEFQRYEQYLHRELPQLVRRRLEEAVSGFTTPLENQLRAQLVDIVRDSQSELFRSYRPTATTSSMPVRGGLDSTPHPLNSIFQQQLPASSAGDGMHDLGENHAGAHQASEGATAFQDFDGSFVADLSSLVDFSAYGEPPTMHEEELARLSSTDVSSWADQGTTANLNSYSLFSDSGYGSNMNEDFAGVSGSYSDKGDKGKGFLPL